MFSICAVSLFMFVLFKLPQRSKPRICRT